VKAPRLLSENQIRIIDYLSGRLRTGKEMAEDLKLPLNGIYVSIGRMVADGLLNRNSQARYCSTRFGWYCSEATKKFLADWKEAEPDRTDEQ
jgi:predicted transcriptional regulator